VILVGDDPASHLYVGNKVKACASVGIKSQAYRYGRDVDTVTVLAKIHELNADSGIHGILVQLPLPSGVDMPRIISAISVQRSRRLPSIQRGRPRRCNTIFSPCTPYGVMKLLEAEEISIRWPECRRGRRK